jgi:hypothetical protein
MPITCPLLGDDDRYERTVTAWVDSRPGGLLRLIARLHDLRADVEVTLDIRPTPSFDVVEASGAVRAPGVGGDDLGPRLSRLAGLRLASGFRRGVTDVVGAHPLAGLAADATIEAARLSRQVARLGSPMPSEPTASDFRQLDLTAWPDLVDLCFTYSGASAPLFRERRVRVPSTLDMYAPREGARVVFHRYKRTAIARAGGVLALYQSMFDQAHGFELWYDVDVETGRILRARSLTPRLPYLGVCEEPQGRSQALVGVAIDDRWLAKVREATGGPRGCFQLTDLTTDLFRLLKIT